MNREPFPWPLALAVGLGVLRLSPEQFWRMTPREFAAALHGLYGDAAPLDRVTFDALRARFPDTHESSFRGAGEAREPGIQTAGRQAEPPLGFRARAFGASRNDKEETTP